MRRRYRAATAAVAAVAFGAGVAAAAPALADTSSSAGDTLTAKSASWGAAPTATGATPNGSSYTMTWNLPATASQYFQVSNTGSVGLTGQTYTVSNSKPTNGNAPPTIAIDACVGAAWNTTTNTCAGTVTRLTTSAAQGSTTVTVAIAAGAALSCRATPMTLPNFPQPFTTNVSVSVDRTLVRSATTSNS